MSAPALWISGTSSVSARMISGLATSKPGPRPPGCRPPAPLRGARHNVLHHASGHHQMHAVLPSSRVPLPRAAPGPCRGMEEEALLRRIESAWTPLHGIAGLASVLAVDPCAPHRPHLCCAFVTRVHVVPTSRLRALPNPQEDDPPTEDWANAYRGPTPDTIEGPAGPGRLRRRRCTPRMLPARPSRQHGELSPRCSPPSRPGTEQDRRPDAAPGNALGHERRAPRARGP